MSDDELRNVLRQLYDPNEMPLKEAVFQFLIKYNDIKCTPKVLYKAYPTAKKDTLRAYLREFNLLNSVPVYKDRVDTIRDNFKYKEELEAFKEDVRKLIVLISGKTKKASRFSNEDRLLMKKLDEYLGMWEYGGKDNE